MARYFFFFFFNDTATTEIYTLSLHDALPISHQLHFGKPKIVHVRRGVDDPQGPVDVKWPGPNRRDRKSTRLNSSHLVISYAVFCLKKKNDREAEVPHSTPTRASLERPQGQED